MAAEAVATPGLSAACELKTALRHTITWGIGGILAKVVSFCMLPYYTHHLGPRDYGLLEILDLAMSLVGLILNMGTAPWIIREYRLATSEQDRRSLLSSTLVFTVLTAVILLSSGFVFIPPASLLLLGPEIPWYYLYLSFSQILIGYVGVVPYTYLRAKELSGSLVIFDTIGTFVLLALTVFAISGLHLGVIGMLLSSVLCNILRVLTALIWVRRDMSAAMDFKRVRSLITFGAPLILANLTMFILNFSDRFFLQRFASLEAVGVYAVAYKFGYMLYFLLIIPFNTMWQVRMYIIHRREDHQEVFGHVFSLYFATLTFAALGTALFAPEVMMAVVDSRFRSGAPLIGVVTSGYVLLGMGQYLQTGMYLSGRTNGIAMISVCVAMIAMGANFVLIRSLGALGAAWATFAGFLAFAVGSYYYSQRVLPFRFGLGRALMGATVGAGLYWISRELPASSLLAGLAWKTALLAMFPVLLWRIGFFTRGDLALLATLRQSITRRGRSEPQPVHLAQAGSETCSK